MAGGEFRLGTDSIYMAGYEHGRPLRTSLKIEITWLRFGRQSGRKLSFSKGLIILPSRKLGLNVLRCRALWPTVCGAASAACRIAEAAPVERSLPKSPTSDSLTGSRRIPLPGVVTGASEAKRRSSFHNDFAIQHSSRQRGRPSDAEIWTTTLALTPVGRRAERTRPNSDDVRAN